MSRVLAPALLLTLFTSAPNAQVFIVDAATGGPGALQATINLAPAGSILRIRPGTYSAATISRPFHMIGEGAVLVEQLSISGIGLGQTLSFVGLSITGVPGTGVDTPAVNISSCAGGVMFSACSIAGRQQSATLNPVPRRCVVAVTDAALFADQCSIYGTAGRETTIFGDFYPSAGICAVRATLSLARCTVTGGIGSYVPNTTSGYRGQDGGAAILVQDGVLIVNHCQITGGTGGLPFGGIFCNNSPGGRGQPALACGSLDKVVLAGNTTTLTAGFTPRPICTGISTSSAVLGTGEVVVDPSVRLVPDAPAPAVDPRASLTTRPVSSLFANQALVNLNSFVSWSHRDLPGTYVFILLSSGAFPAVPHPVVFGGLNVDFTHALITGPLQVDSSGALTFAFSVPFDPSLRGARLFVETVGVDARLTPNSTGVSMLAVSFN
jgi:hypothetical protein